MISLIVQTSQKSPPELRLEPIPAGGDPPRPWGERILWALVGVVILNWSTALYGPASYFGPIALLDVGAGIWGLGLIIVSLLDLRGIPSLRRTENWVEWATLLLLVVLIGVWTYIQFHNIPSYATDELSFDQYSAQLVAHGLNPYTHSMAPAPPLYRLSPDAYSYTITGHPVKALSYPSLSFLLYVPFMLLGWYSEVGAALNVAGWVASVVLLFVLLPREMRAIALILSSIDTYLAFAVGGVTDMLYIPLLLIAAYKWDRFERVRGWRSYIGPVALACAMGIKQTPWPVLGFVVLALALDEYDRSLDVRAAAGRAGRYLAIVLAAFLVPNLPFIFAAPVAWFNGVFTPLVSNLVPSGQGLISLTLFAHLGGGSLGAYAVVLVLVALLLVVVFIGTYPLLRPATFLLAALAYFVAARSQTNYLIALVPPALLGAVTARPELRPLAGARGRVLGVIRSARWAWVTGLSATVVTGVIAYALLAPSPLYVKITGIRTTGFLAGIRALALDVHNNTGRRLTPSYTIQTTHGDTTFWDVSSGPKSLAPGQHATVEIQAPNVPSELGLGEGFSVLAFTNSPAAVSVSHRFLMNLWRTAFIPQAFNVAEPVGKRLKLQVDVLDHFDNPVQRKGIAVYLTQLRYVGRGFRRGTARIFGAPGSQNTGVPGKSNIVAYTNGQGVATFHIVGRFPSDIPITFAGHLHDVAAKYVYGGTGPLDIRFKKASASG